VSAGWSEQPGDHTTMHDLVALPAKDTHEIVRTGHPAPRRHDLVSLSPKSLEPLCVGCWRAHHGDPLGLQFVVSGLQTREIGHQIEQVIGPSIATGATSSG
jgi:hypothetical protein